MTSNERKGIFHRPSPASILGGTVVPRPSESRLAGERSSIVPYTPQSIEVTIREEKPSAIILKGRRHRVREILNMWRIDEEWWRRPISRLYFLMELETSARITVFQDLGDGQWYRQNWA